MLQPDPIVVEVINQPPITPEISYAGILLSALGLVGVIVISAGVVGLLAGWTIIAFKRRHLGSEPGASSHVRLRI